MEIITLKNIQYFSCNTYLLIENGHGVLIDPGFFNHELALKLKSLSSLDAILLTHKHFDHIRGLDIISKMFPETKIYSYLTKDKFLLDTRINCSYYMTPDNLVFFNNLKINNLSDGDFSVDDFKFKIYHTPGHTSDSVIILIADNIFVGDLVFRQGIGRCDLPTSSKIDMELSLKLFKKIITGRHFEIYFGHDDSISSEELLLKNVYLK